MTQKFNDAEGYIRLIKSEERCFDEITATYRFYEVCVPDMRAQYAIAISTEDEECFAVLGDRREDAYLFCDEIISGGVMPCTLHDIVSDRQKEEYYLY